MKSQDIDSIRDLIYIDGSATSPPYKEVIDVIRDVELGSWGNPSSIHRFGLMAAETLERSRFEIASILKANPSEIIFTSGATESITLAIHGISQMIKPGTIVISSIEHPSVEETAANLRLFGWNVIKWPVNNFGIIDLNYADKFLDDDTRIVSCIWGQSEIGTIQPIIELGNLCRQKGIVFHTDATQYLIQNNFCWSTLPVDLLSFSGHKLRATKGIGALLIKDHLIKMIKPIILGGKQENNLRSGTEPVALAAGLAKALQLLTNSFVDDKLNTKYSFKEVKQMTSRLRAELSKNPQIIFTGDSIQRLSHHISFIASNSKGLPISGTKLIMALSNLGIAASSGSACSSGTQTGSKVLKAIGVPKEYQRSGIRFSLGTWLDFDDVKLVPELLEKALYQLDYEP